MLGVSKENDVLESYYWGYQKQYPIAHAINAKGGEIYYEPFEEKAGWSGTQWQYGDVPLSAYDPARSITGKFSARIDNASTSEKYAHADHWLDVSHTATTRYKYSGWVYSTASSAEIFLFMKSEFEGSYFTHVHSIVTHEKNKWVYIEGYYDVPNYIKKLGLRLDNNGSGNVWFDDVKLHPVGARMTTYTFDPLVGMTSQTDINNRRTHYTYDGMGRLSLLLDHDRNVIKKYCYNYQGEQEDCSVDCATAVDNWQNTTTPIRCKVNSNGQYTGEQEQEQRNLNPCAPPNQLRWVVVGTNTTACPLPVTTIYAKLHYENGYSDWTTQYADVVVRFYADAACTTPITVSNVQVNYGRSGYDGYGYYSQSSSILGNGYFRVIRYNAMLVDNSYYPPVYEDFYLEPGNYTIVW